MKVVIIEDERLSAEDLADILVQLPGDIEVEKTLGSIAESIDYFNGHPSPDLIFCDIELGDGQSFELFEKIELQAPVIFCTAHDEFALQAFRNNGIDYILKPFTRKTIKKAIDKYQAILSRNMQQPFPYDNLKNDWPHFPGQAAKVSSLLVNWKDRIIPVKISDIALFHIDYKMVQLVSFAQQKYFVSYTLDELEVICGSSFYRANRQYLINRESILEVLQYHARKLLVKVRIEGHAEILISKNKVPDFLNWLKG